MYLQILEIFYGVVQVLLFISIIVIVFPFVHYFILNLLYTLIGTPFGLQPDVVSNYVGMLFFPGTLLKLLVRSAIVPLLGGQSGTNMGMNFRGVYANTWVDLNGRLSREALFIFSPYILLFLEIPLALYFMEIVDFLSYNGISILFSMIIVGYVMISIVVTGLPTPQDVYAFFVLFTRNHPLTFFMLMGILFDSLLLVSFLGIDLASSFAFFQIIAFLVIEVRTSRILNILSNPDENPEAFLNLVDLGVI